MGCHEQRPNMRQTIIVVLWAFIEDGGVNKKGFPLRGKLSPKVTDEGERKLTPHPPQAVPLPPTGEGKKIKYANVFPAGKTKR